jgi:translation initiation factor 2 subunit 2
MPDLAETEHAGKDLEPIDGVPAFDLTSKKKKKKKKALEDDDADDVGNIADAVQGINMGSDSAGNGPNLMSEDVVGIEAPQEFAALDFGGMKKKKKKKVVFDDDMNEDELVAQGEEAIGGEKRERHSRREIISQPWDGSDREYTYEELLIRALQFLHGTNPSLSGGGGGRKKITLQLPQVAREGTKKTVFLNFGGICKSIHRQQDHLLAYMGAELGTSGNIQDGGRLVIKGRFTAEGIANVLKRYMMDYVICQSCRSQDTVLMRDANTRLYFVSCESCGARRSVANISAGYVARVERRKKVG